MTIEQMREEGDAPPWMTPEGYLTLCGGYLIGSETPREMYTRVSEAAASYYSDTAYWSKRFFDAMWSGWLCPATPVLSNLGSDRGLPISCNSIHVDDSLDSIFMKNYELAMLSKNGAGVGIYIGDVR